MFNSTQKERPMTRDEMNKRIEQMTAEWQRQKCEAKVCLSQGDTRGLHFQPMTRDEMNARIQQMREERQRQYLASKPSITLGKT